MLRVSEDAGKLGLTCDGLNIFYNLRLLAFDVLIVSHTDCLRGIPFQIILYIDLYRAPTRDINQCLHVEMDAMWLLTTSPNTRWKTDD